METMRENKRTKSLMKPASNVLDERYRQVKAVRDGYLSKKMFEHTIQDVMKVMDHKIAKRNQETRDAILKSRKDEDEKAAEAAAAEEKKSGGALSKSNSPVREEPSEQISQLDSAAAAQLQQDYINLVDDKKMAEGLLHTIIGLGVRAPLKDVQAMIKEFLQLQLKDEITGDSETLIESILYQYAYLENLIRTCKEEKDPKGPSQRIIRGTDAQYNAKLSEAR